MTKVVPSDDVARKPSRLTFADNGSGAADATGNARSGLEWSYSAGPTASSMPSFMKPEDGNLGKASGLQRVNTMAAVKSASRALKTISKGATSRGVRHSRGARHVREKCLHVDAQVQRFLPYLTRCQHCEPCINACTLICLEHLIRDWSLRNGSARSSALNALSTCREAEARAKSPSSELQTTPTGE